MIKLDVPFKELKTIHHLADIHIRNLKRHTEYREVFNKTYEKIKENSDNAIIYIGGDVVHAKLDMSPELVDLTSDFFRSLADIAPTIIITGNHDCNLNNLSRLDALQPIINNLTHPNIHYLKDTGVYKVADTTLSVMSVFDEHHPDRYPLAKDIEGDTKIAFFHGTVDNSTTDFGFRLPSDVKIEIFDGYDMALLGDIHKRQFLNKEHTIAYCGSLIQQNHGELLDHGFLTWDVPSRKATFNRIENDYGYYTLEVEDGVVPIVDDMPKKARLRVRVTNTDSSQVKKLTSEIHSRYNIKEITINRMDTLSKSKTGDRTNKIDIGDVRNPDFQYELIHDYLNRNYVIDDSILLKIKQINEDLNSQLPEEEISRNINWKLKRFEFDNMFSYGEGNVLDFEKLNGVAGLFAPNASGKSSLLDAISFCLFDTTSRTMFARDVLNNKKNWFKCRLNFSINDEEYWIERRAKKHRNGHVKVDVDFWTIDDAGDVVSINGDQRRTTNLNIRRVIGDYNDFILTALSLQTNGNVFIEKTQKERKEILAQFMDINIFDQLYTLALEEIHDVSSLLRQYKKQDYGYELSTNKKIYDEQTKEYSKFDKIKKDLISSQKKYGSEVLLLSKKLKPVDSTIVDIDNLESLSVELNQDLDNLEDKIIESERNIRNNNTDTDKISNGLKNIDVNKLKENYFKYSESLDDKDKLEHQIQEMKTDIRFKLDKVNKLEEHEYDPNCEYCVKNPFVVDAQKTKGELEQDKLEVRKVLDSLKNVEEIIDSLKYVEEEKETFDKLTTKLEKLNNIKSNLNTEQIGLVSQKSNLETQIETVDDKIVKYYENEETIKDNKVLENKIQNCQEEYDLLDDKISQSREQLRLIQSKVNVAENHIRMIEDKIQEIKDLEEKFQAYEYYMDGVKRDGVPYELITKVLPTIETEVNDILSQIVDFNIMLEMDGKNINTKIVYDEDNYWPLELSSGMERFIAALSLRIALINVSNLPRPDFLAIDEGFGVLDSDNLNSLHMLFDYLKSQFKFLMIISHIDAMKDLMDTLIEIKKEKGYSSTKYLP